MAKKLGTYPIEFIKEQCIQFNKLMTMDGKNVSHRGFYVESGTRASMDDKQLEEQYYKWLEKKFKELNGCLEKIKFSLELRTRGLDMDIKTQKNKEFFKGGKDAIKEFIRKLSNMKYIDSDIKGKGKYMSSEERRKWITREAEI